MAGRIRLGELLVRAGLIDELKLRAALAQQKKWGGRLGKVLVDMNFVSEDVLVRALSKQLGVPRADFDDAQVPAEILRQISPEFAEQNDICPLRFDAERRVLTVATCDPTNVSAIDELRFLTGLRIESALAGPSELVRHRARLMGTAVPYSLPEAIELDEIPEGPIVFNEDHSAAMAASGLESGPVPTEAPPVAPSAPPVAPGPPPVAPCAPPGTPNPPATRAEDLVERLDAAQQQQQRALRVLMDLLVEKGVFSREDLHARMTSP